MKKKRKKKQNEENAGLNVANADEKGKTKSYYKSYLFDALYFSRSQNSYSLSGGKLICSARCSALEIESRIKQHFSSLNRCHACIERNEFRFPVGTPSISLRWTYFRVISDARLIPNTTDSSTNAHCLYLCLIIKHLKVSKVSARNVSMKALFVKYLRFNVSSSVT